MMALIVTAPTSLELGLITYRTATKLAIGHGYNSLPWWSITVATASGSALPTATTSAASCLARPARRAPSE